MWGAADVSASAPEQKVFNNAGAVWIFHAVQALKFHHYSSRTKMISIIFLDISSVVAVYMAMPHIWRPCMLDSELKRGSTEMLILALVEDRPRHGYEIAKLIEQRSEGKLQFHAASLYPLLYRLEKRGLINGRWVEKPGQRRRRFYRLTAKGQKMLAAQRQTWRDFFEALDRVAGINPA